MAKKTGQEKRLYPRLNQELPVKIAANGFDFVTTTQNISCLGAYCHIDKYVPPFTKILIKLNLPKESENIECYGVIVRTEDEAKGGFNIAIFFNKIKEIQRQKIAQYLNKFLPANSLQTCQQ